MILALVIVGVIAVGASALAIVLAFLLQDVTAEAVASSAEAVYWRDRYLKLWQHAASGMADLRHGLNKFPGADVLTGDDVVLLDGTCGRGPDDTNLPPQWDHVEGD